MDFIKLQVYLKENGIPECGPDATHVILMDEGEGYYIKEWNVDKEKPTKEIINSMSDNKKRKYMKEIEKRNVRKEKSYGLLENLCGKLKINVEELFND